MDQEGLGSASLVASTLRIATPLLFASLGGLISERSGIIQIGLEGFMLVGALAAAIVTYSSGSPWTGFIFAGIVSGLFALLFSLFTVNLKANHVVVGTAFNILAIGLCPLVTKAIYNSTGSTPGIALASRFSMAPVVIALVLVVFIHYVFQKTRWGIILRFSGEAPKALLSYGYSVIKTRTLAVMACGVLCGFGGASLSLFLSSSYSPNMTAGRGFMALAALILGKWKPIPTFLACIFFALIEALQIRLQGNFTAIPIEFIQLMPYIITCIVVSGFVGKTSPPASLGHDKDSN